MVIILCDSKAMIIIMKSFDTIFFGRCKLHPDKSSTSLAAMLRAPILSTGSILDTWLVLAKLMDAGFEAITATRTANSDYVTDYQFSAILFTDTNRSKLGYDLGIIVHSNKSDSWVDAIFLFLHHQGLEPVMMV